MGYSTYLSLVISIVSNALIIYALGLKGVPLFETIFPHLANFLIIGVIVFVPTATFLGWIHIKRMSMYSTDTALATEISPYTYKTIGKEKEVFIPLWVLTVRGLGKLLERQGTMTDEDRKELNDLLDKANALLEGQYAGVSKEYGVRRFPGTQGDK
jgi:hypothetical protein